MAKKLSPQISCCIKNKHRCMKTNDEPECVRLGGYPINTCSKCK